MRYAEIKINIFVDENKLTFEQRRQATAADEDIYQDYPLASGVDDLRDTIEQVGLQSFRYLKEGIKAVEIIVD